MYVLKAGHSGISVAHRKGLQRTDAAAQISVVAPRHPTTFAQSRYWALLASHASCPALEIEDLAVSTLHLTITSARPPPFEHACYSDTHERWKDAVDVKHSKPKRLRDINTSKSKNFYSTLTLEARGLFIPSCRLLPGCICLLLVIQNEQADPPALENTS